MPHLYTEDQLIEQPAIRLFAELGWDTASAMEEVFGAGGTLGRETKVEAVIEPRLRATLERLNPSLPAEAISLAIDTLTRDRSAMSLGAANREIYELLKVGIKICIPDSEHGGQKTERARAIDWQNPAANDFLLVSQFSVTGPLYTCRLDLVGFVNGLPFVVIELKKPRVSARQAFDDNLTSYKHLQNGIPALFGFNALLIASNGTESRVGSLTADWERFFEWKRIEREGEPRRVSLEVMIRGVCEPTRLLDLIESFTLFSEHKAGLVKILGQNHQYLGVNNAIAATLAARRQGHGRGGVFWQTQGAGKSFSMIFFAQKILRKIPGNWTFVIVTDRMELDDQIAKTFKAAGAVSQAEGDECHAQTSAHLRELLKGNHRYVFTLIHKFRPETPSPDPSGHPLPKGEGRILGVMPVLSDRRDIIVLTDEAHRSQYDTLALNMRTALPNALFLAFTGTPLIAGEERTREVFGDYVSIYDFQQSVEDGATVPLFYENRTPELRLENPDLNEDLYVLIEEADLSEEAEKRLERELGRQYHLITRDDRLETVAKDIVQHFLGRGFQGKAMVVSIDKATALRMHDKVQKYWQAEQMNVERELIRLKGEGYGSAGASPSPAGGSASEVEDRIQELEQRLRTLKTTDMALIVSPGQNEIEQMKKLGLDIVPHRQRMNVEALDEKFKDSDDPLRLVFLCAMWLTGFDAPSCSTVYLDKPMRNHTLMQTIARANRVFPGKHSGLIVDYANVFASLEKALAIYGAGRGGATPVRDKAQLIAELRQALAEASAFCAGHGVDLDAAEAARSGSFDRVKLIGEAVEKLISPDPVRKEFLAYERLVSTLLKAVKPDPAVVEFVPRASCLATIADAIRQRISEGQSSDISAILAEVKRLLDDSVAAEAFRIRDKEEKYGRGGIDLSKIDFEKLAKRFAQSKTKNIELEQLKAAIRTQLNRLVQLNRTRADYLAKFEDLIESYNAGSRNIEELFRELVALSRSLSDEQERHVRENLTEEELTVFDILTRPGPELTTEEREEVKKVTKALLQRLKLLLVLDWRQRVGARASVRQAIENELDDGLPRAYSPELYQRKVSAVFEHVFESYQGEGSSVYTM